MLELGTSRESSRVNWVSEGCRGEDRVLLGRREDLGCRLFSCRLFFAASRCLCRDFSLFPVVWYGCTEKVAKNGLFAVFRCRFCRKLFEIWMTLCNFVGEELRCHVKETENRED